MGNSTNIKDRTRFEFYISVSSVRDSIVLNTDKQTTTFANMLSQTILLRDEFSNLCTLSIIEVTTGRVCIQYIGAGAADDPTLLDSSAPFSHRGGDHTKVAH